MMSRWVLLLLTGCSEFSLDDPDQTVLDAMIVEESFLYQTEHAIDILLVIDDTSSMRTELVEFSAQLPALLDGLEQSTTAWQVGAVTTDIASDHAAVLQGDPWVLTPTTPEPEMALRQMTDVGHEGTGPEAGLAAALWALSPPLIDGPNRGIRRSNAALHIVVVSDGDDQSDEWFGEDATAQFQTFLQSQISLGGEPARLSALVGPTPNGCTSTMGTARPGHRYLAIANESRGYTGSICDLDLATLAAWLAETSHAEQPRFSLQATPHPESIRVQVNDTRWDDGWLLVEDSVIELITKPPAGAEIRIRYEVQSS